MEKKTRRTLHQVWCDMIDKGEDYSTADIEWVWYDGKIYKCDVHNYLGEYFLHTPNGKEVVHMDPDQIHEDCYEVFEEELKALLVLYSNK